MLIGIVTACTPETPEPKELSFANHWGVMRGSWEATGNFPGEALELQNLEASCTTAEEDRCYSYDFSGTVFFDGETASLTGRGRAGAGNVYTLTSPLPDMGFEGAFTINDESWELYSLTFFEEDAFYKVQLYNQTTATAFEADLKRKAGSN